jgi:beta-N-acetylhexosaminidase
MGLKRAFLAILLTSLVLGALAGPNPVRAQGIVPPVAVRALFQKMTPEERIGQLFLVTFNGTDTSDKSQIYDLIVNHHVGGLVLSAADDNFVAAPNTVASAYQLTSSLQAVEWNTAVNPPLDSHSGQPAPHQYAPLFIAISQAGDGSPGDQILNGLTPLPSEMAIGATWSADLARQAGTVMGSELSALGINMVFGPSLDVLENPNPTPYNDLGVGVFGGNPYWVGVLGSAYIAGLHTGSKDSLLVVPEHFPGSGSADRASNLEVATVRKSLDQLKRVELYPFFSVTGNASAPASTADGLLLSHIRYQGFQGNIRATTKPVSFDAQALASILAIKEFDTWRQQGGLIISDNLGTEAVKQFYTTGTDFPARTVARDAFVAGSDMLYLGNIVSSDAPDTYSTVLQILTFFAQKYRDDPAFAQRVDTSVLRILSMKYHLYGSLNYEAVTPNSDGLAKVGQSEQTTLNVAGAAASLLSPDARDLATVLPNPPQVKNHIVFFTDTSQVQQCSTCTMQTVPDVQAMENAVTQLYGPQSGNQSSSAFRMSSYSFKDISDYLAGKSPPYLTADLSSADWVILALVDGNNGQANLISNFLSSQQDLLRDKRVILFDLGAPYYLDATDISRLTAYYAVYGKTAPFVAIAARLLFQEITPIGAPPVSISGLGYDLATATSPDPNQLIALNVDFTTGPVVTSVATNAPTTAPTAVPLYRIGDTIAVRAGPIKDHNGKTVPDGTVVQFSMNVTGEGGGILQQANTTTTQGVARVSFGLDKPGLLQIQATSNPATISEVLQLDVSSGGQPAQVTVIVPQLTPQASPPVVNTPVPAQDEFITRDGRPRFSAWLVTVLIILAGASGVLYAGLRLESPRWGTRWSLCALAGGLLVYNYFAVGMPGSSKFAADNGLGGVLVLTILGLLSGWGAGWLWSQQQGRK